MGGWEGGEEWRGGRGLVLRGEEMREQRLSWVVD